MPDKFIVPERVTREAYIDLLEQLEASERALRWMATEWAKYAEDTSGDPHPDLVQGGIDLARESASSPATEPEGS